MEAVRRREDCDVDARRGPRREADDCHPSKPQLWDRVNLAGWIDDEDEVRGYTEIYGIQSYSYYNSIRSRISESVSRSVASVGSFADICVKMRCDRALLFKKHPEMTDELHEYMSPLVCLVAHRSVCY